MNESYLQPSVGGLCEGTMHSARPRLPSVRAETHWIIQSTNAPYWRVREANGEDSKQSGPGENAKSTSGSKNPAEIQETEKRQGEQSKQFSVASQATTGLQRHYNIRLQTTFYIHPYIKAFVQHVRRRPFCMEADLNSLHIKK